MKLKVKNLPGRIIDHILPALVWLAAIGAIIFIVRDKGQKFETIGIVNREERTMESPCAGRIKSVAVSSFNKVEKGQPLVIIDTVLDPEQNNNQINAQRDIILAKIKQLQAELAATENKLKTDSAAKESDFVTSSRNFAVDVEKTRLETVQLKAQTEPAKIRLKKLEYDIKIANANSAVTGQNLIQLHYEIEKWKQESAALAKEIEENEKLLAQAEENLKLAQSRKEEFEKQNPLHPSIEAALQPIHEAINVQEKTLAQLLIEQPIVTVEAPFDGVITNIVIRNNDTIANREPMLTIVETEPKAIIAYIKEEQTSMVKEKMEVSVMKRTYPQKIAKSQITYLSPVMELLPQQLWLANNMPQWGRPIIIEIPPDFDVIPGEVVNIQGF
jgi:multidrug resistance efflux pump